MRSKSRQGGGVEDWVAVPEEKFVTVLGDVNCEVEGGNGKSILWFAYKDWPNQTFEAANLRAKLTAWDPVDPPDYMVVDLAVTNGVNYYVSTNALPGGVGDIRYRKDKLLMRHIRAAGQTFRMGSPLTETARATPVSQNADEVAHLVSFTEDFWIGVFQFTYGNVRVAYANNDAYAGGWHKADDADFALTYPAEAIKISSFFGTGDVPGEGSALKALQDATGVPLTLPTEAQWEFAARAGVGADLPNGLTIYSNGESPKSLNPIAWNNSNSGGTTHPVGLLAPNNWGLYDVIGNVREICRDGFVRALSSEYAVDPFTTNSGTSYHVARGGQCQYNAQNDRSAVRFPVGTSPANPSKENGFRLSAPCPIK